MNNPTHRITLRCHSAIHVRQGDKLRLEADDASTGPMRLYTLQSEYERGLPTFLVADVYVALDETGKASQGPAVDASGDAINDLQLLAVLYNSAVHAIEVTGVYELRSGGTYYQQSFSLPRRHADVRTRQATGAWLVDTLGSIARPTISTRLWSAITQYNYALCALDPHRTLEAALRLFPSAENLTVHCMQRLQRESGLDDRAHANTIGVQTIHKRGINKGEDIADWHYQYKGKIRRDYVFTDNPDDFTALRLARNDFEHASADMNDLRQRVTPLISSLFGQVRRAILRELSLSDTGRARVTRSAYDRPLANWPTRVVIEGTFAGPPSIFAPDAPRLELNSQMADVNYLETAYDAESGVRTGELKFLLNSAASDELPVDVVGQITGTNVFSANDWDATESSLRETTIFSVTRNGVDITDEVLREQPPADEVAG